VSARTVGQRDEDIIIKSILAKTPFGIHSLDGAEEHECLIHQVAAEVEHRSTACDSWPSVWGIALKARLETSSYPESSTFHKSPNREEVRVPTAVLIWREHKLAILCKCNCAHGRQSVERERLVTDGCKTSLEHSFGEFGMRMSGG
jgi:hypothetical protein